MICHSNWIVNYKTNYKMKMLRRLSMFVVLLLSVFAVYAGGIGNVKELIAFAKAVNSGADLSEWKDEKGVVCLEGDIDMKKAKKLPVIEAFTGVFDGKGYALKNWKAKNALIHELKAGSEVRNLRIDASCSMKVTSGSETFVRGFIVNINCGTLRNCENYGSIQHRADLTTAYIYIGGLCGHNRYVIIDCKNGGNIVSETLVASPKKAGLLVGGLAGHSNKHLKCASYIRCENSGNITVQSDMPETFVGGITGQATFATLKHCVNRGDVSATASKGAAKINGRVYMGGVVGHTKAHIICCDNFGKVESKGVYQVRMAGIVGMPNGKLNITGCSNYGKILSATDGMSLVGGIVGTMALETHIHNGNNYGEIAFVGLSPKASYIAGIVGSVGSVKKATHGAYLRRCNNYGKVTSGNGGNSYEDSNHSIHTGGIAGRSIGTAKAPITFTDCANRGEVLADGGRKHDIVPYTTYTKIVGGYFHNNYAEKAEPMAGGATIYGRVTSTTGAPLKGVVVTDSYNCVQTDAEGRYALKSDMSKVNFVYISVPDGYKVPFRNSVPQIFRRVHRHSKGAVANFVLEKREQPMDDYIVAMIGDPQMRGFNHDTSSEKFRDVILPDVVALSKKEGKPIFTINLGDLCYNWMPAYDDYLDIVAGSGVEMFHVIGNHDFDQATILETKLGTQFFEEYISPTNYSFNIGKIHYIMVNDINYVRPNSKKHYGYGLDNDAVKWLEQDLSYVPKDHSIVICAHAHLHRHIKKALNYNRYSAALAKFKKVYSWSGHYHNNFGADYEGVTKNNLGNVIAVSVARCSGNLRANRDLHIDGTPNGYMAVEVKGDNLEWYYKSIGRERDYQIRGYSPSRTGDGYVKACIWNYTKGFWSEPEWWENGKKVGTLEQHKEEDLDALAINQAAAPLVAKADPSVTWTSSKGRVHDYTKPNKSKLMFRIKPSEGVRSGEIRVTDNFGKTYTCKVEW